MHLCALVPASYPHAPFLEMTLFTLPSVLAESLNAYKVKVKVKSLSRVQFFATLWTVADQASQSMGFSRQEYWSGLPFPFPGDLPNPGIEPRSPALQADALTSEPPEKPQKDSNVDLTLFSTQFQSTPLYFSPLSQLGPAGC